MKIKQFLVDRHNCCIGWNMKNEKSLIWRTYAIVFGKKQFLFHYLRKKRLTENQIQPPKWQGDFLPVYHSHARLVFTLGARSTKNPDWSTGPLARPFVRSLTPPTHSLAPHFSRHWRAPLRSFVRLLAHFASSLAHENVDDWMAFFSVIFFCSGPQWFSIRLWIIQLAFHKCHVLLDARCLFYDPTLVYHWTILKDLSKGMKHFAVERRIVQYSSVGRTPKISWLDQWRHCWTSNEHHCLPPFWSHQTKTYYQGHWAFLMYTERTTTKIIFIITVFHAKKGPLPRKPSPLFSNHKLKNKLKAN